MRGPRRCLYAATLVLVACAREPPAAAVSAEPWSQVTGEEQDLTACQASPYPEMRALCFRLAADAATTKGALDRAERACDACSDSTWRTDCFMSLAQARAAEGSMGQAVEACRRSAGLSSVCLDHIGYERRRLPVDGRLGLVFDQQVAQLQDLPSSWNSTRDLLALSYWRLAYNGARPLDPRPAQAVQGRYAKLARAAYMQELARSLELPPTTDLVETRDLILAAWSTAPTTPVHPRWARDPVDEVLRGEIILPGGSSFGCPEELRVAETAEQQATADAIAHHCGGPAASQVALAPYLEADSDTVRKLAQACTIAADPQSEASATLCAQLGRSRKAADSCITRRLCAR
jgi:hypothetical protein